jgi:hypothetical protein
MGAWEVPDGLIGKWKAAWRRSNRSPGCDPRFSRELEWNSDGVEYRFVSLFYQDPGRCGWQDAV